MVKFVISEAPTGWSVARFGDSIKTIAFTPTEFQARAIANECARKEKPSMIIKISKSGLRSVIAIFEAAEDQPNQKRTR